MERQWVISRIKFIITDISNLLLRMEEQIENLPRGTVRHRKVKDKQYYEHLIDGKRNSLGNDVNEVQRILRRKIIEAELAPLRFACKKLQEICNKLLDNKYDNTSIKLRERFGEIDFDNVIFNNAVVQFMAQCGNQNPLHPEHLRYRTNNGVMVRSKSELIIANMLEAYGIIYRYELKLNYQGHIYYPDFTIIKPDGMIIIWEHFGLLDNEQYRNKSALKIQAYAAMGYKQHTNLIITTEDDIQDPDVLEGIIKRFLFS